jgi:gas vesicle protein
MASTGKKWGVIGAALGAVAGILFAPKSGKETRADIKTGAEEVKSKASRKYKDVKSEIEEKTKVAKTTAKTYQDKTKRAAKRAAADVREEFKR